MEGRVCPGGGKGGSGSGLGGGDPPFLYLNQSFPPPRHCVSRWMEGWVWVDREKVGSGWGYMVCLVEGLHEWREGGVRVEGRVRWH